ncbi:MAG: cob(I)yrinic acid a,c-diamide adenosyltransferase [Oscillospiraceae bacterium]|nr:cob(I)yrinic acid a,c-diamide adenosyltransferase [Oscillospiraceae bacterium]
MIKNGMVHYYYGYGKGKTSAAVGSAVRAAGYGNRVMFVQFLKNTASGETKVLDHIPGVTVLRGIGTDKFSISMNDDEKESVRRIHDGFLREVLNAVETHAADVVVLDELADAVELGLADKEIVSEIIERCGGNTELVITGHRPVQFFIDNADYVTEMKKVRHPFDRGIRAREGVEY